MKRPSWMYKQSGTVPYKIIDDDIWILLISNRKGTKWIIPKGIVDRSMKASESALKETQEEAGVKGCIIRPALGRYKTNKWGGRCRIKIFLLSVEQELEDWPESSFRKRKWVKLQEIDSYIKNRKLNKLFSFIPAFLAQNILKN